MITKEHSVKEWHFRLDTFPQLTFRVQADTIERAKKVLKADLGKALKELTEAKESQPTRAADATVV
jgi:hypothetical protein